MWSLGAGFGLPSVAAPGVALMRLTSVEMSLDWQMCKSRSCRNGGGCSGEPGAQYGYLRQGTVRGRARPAAGGRPCGVDQGDAGHGDEATQKQVARRLLRILLQPPETCGMQVSWARSSSGKHASESRNLL